jgi:hypothetical protein
MAGLELAVFPLRNGSDPAATVGSETGYASVVQLIRVREADEIDRRHGGPSSTG